MADREVQVYLNGAFLPRSEAKLDIEDRGALFADGVYEVVAYFGGRPLAMARHVARLRNSLRAIDMADGPADDIEQVSNEVVRRSGHPNARVYWQVTRGAAPRDHVFPKDVRPTVLVMARPVGPVDADAPVPTVKVALAEDERWHRCSIKALMLLANVLAMNRASARGFDEAILHRGEVVTECSRCSLFAVRGGELWTHPADQWILGGITRAILIDLAKQLHIAVHERTFSVDQLLAAQEVFICGTGACLEAVTQIEQTRISGGRVGPVTQQLHHAYIAHIQQACGLV